MTVLLTHEPVVNKSRAITANRLVVHAESMDEACDALNEIAPSWPMERTVGKLRYSRAGYNGHVHARCSSGDCVAWME